jgi:S-adenosylmethionine synthetase
MASSRFLFTSESVTEGHPDKVCDQISDAILDAFLTKDPFARVAAETSVTTGLVLVSGEVTSQCYVDIPGIVRQTIEEIGYTGEQGGGFDARTCAVMTSIDEQSADIAAGVDEAQEIRAKQTTEDFDKVGAGDQGLMFGFACDETDNLMPLPIQLAHQLAHRLAEVRKNGILTYLRPDGKSQVTVEYVDNRPARIDTIVISTQHAPSIEHETDNAKIQARIEADLKKFVIEPVFANYAIKPDADTKYFINPSGRFVIGGPQGDAGLTGRKIIVDTYGGYARHGGGAFSGKDPTKVDRSAAYAARHAAKNVVAAGLAAKCEVQISYAIGKARPVSVNVNTFGTGKLTDDQLADLVQQIFDLRPAAIIHNFDLRNAPFKNGGAFYRKLAAYGHVGRIDLELPWEALDKVDALKQAAQSQMAVSV